MANGTSTMTTFTTDLDTTIRASWIFGGRQYEWPKDERDLEICEMGQELSAADRQGMFFRTLSGDACNSQKPRWQMLLFGSIMITTASRPSANAGTVKRQEWSN